MSEPPWHICQYRVFVTLFTALLAQNPEQNVNLIFVENPFIVPVIGGSVGFAFYFLLLNVLNFKSKNSSPDIGSKEVLTGLSLNLLFGAGTTLFVSLLTPWDLARVQRWMLGNIDSQNTHGMGILVFVFATFLFFIQKHITQLHAFVFGPEFFRSSFQTSKWTKNWSVCFIGLAVVATVAVCGPIAFVGLISSTILRRSKLFLSPIASAAVGGTLLCLSDTLARVLEVWTPSVGLLPIGVFTALLGAPLLVFTLHFDINTKQNQRERKT